MSVEGATDAYDGLSESTEQWLKSLPPKVRKAQLELLTGQRQLTAADDRFLLVVSPDGDFPVVREYVGADIAGSSRTVLDHHRLAPLARQPVGDDAGDGVGGAAGREGDDDFDDDFEQELDDELNEDLGEFDEKIEGEGDDDDVPLDEVEDF